MPSSGFCGYHIHMVHRHTYRLHRERERKQFFLKKKKARRNCVWIKRVTGAKRKVKETRP